MTVQATLGAMRLVDTSACSCGSGLSSTCCCAFDLTTASACLDPDVRILVEQAVRAHWQGAREDAEQLSLAALERAPAQREALRVLYEVRKSAGSSQAAEVLIRRLVALDRNDIWATSELALVLLKKGNLPEAELHARNAVRLAPTNTQAHNLMGMILTEAHRPQFGEYHYRSALRLSGARDPILLANLAWNLKNQGKMEEARRLYEESVALAPTVMQTLLGWARLEEADRQFERAADIIDRALTYYPGNSSLLLTRAVLLSRMGRHETALAVLDGIAQANNGTLAPDELREKGALLDRMGRYDEAFAAFAESKRMARECSGQSYLGDQAQDLARRLKRFFIAGRMRILPRAGVVDTTSKPLFILGFPRSGTTLIEQTLSAHPCISAGDELPLIDEIARIMPRILDSPLSYPEALAELWMADHREDLDRLRDFYLQRARWLGAMKPGCSWFTDKMPLNEMHLGLIALLFPDAPLIHVLRHPLDAVLSAFSNHLTHGFFCAYELETAARHYALVMDLVSHYRCELKLRYLAVRYEDVIGDQEASVRRMLDFVGVPFDENCLRFHENRRYARTASYAQVTEPLYARSRFRYRHYMQHLEPVIPILRPAIERLDYSIE